MIKPLYWFIMDSSKAHFQLFCIIFWSKHNWLFQMGRITGAHVISWLSHATKRLSKDCTVQERTSSYTVQIDNKITFIQTETDKINLSCFERGQTHFQPRVHLGEASVIHFILYVYFTISNFVFVCVCVWFSVKKNIIALFLSFYVCMYVRMYVCMYVWVYVCMGVSDFCSCTY